MLASILPKPDMKGAEMIAMLLSVLPPQGKTPGRQTATASRSVARDE